MKSVHRLVKFAAIELWATIAMEIRLMLRLPMPLADIISLWFLVCIAKPFVVNYFFQAQQPP